MTEALKKATKKYDKENMKYLSIGFCVNTENDVYQKIEAESTRLGLSKGAYIKKLIRES